MFKLSALNETSEDVTQVEKTSKDTKEAQEAQAFKLYNEALRLQQNDCRDEAVKVYEQLLETPLIVESATTLVNEHNEAIEHPLKDPGLILKYSAHKNVASICASQGDVKKAMENYLQAVMLDTSDVTLWYKIGIIAAQLSNLHLSRRALTQGLECNPNHWPCLDNLITVCYAILDYENCLAWISKALQKDPCFKKGIYLRRKMISECPHLRKDFDHLFQDCGTEVFEMEISDEDARAILDEALTLRENNRKLCIPPEIPVIPLKLPLKTLTWLSLGRSLIATYEYIETQEEPISITNRIEMKVFEKKELFEGDSKAKHSNQASNSFLSCNVVTETEGEMKDSDNANVDQTVSSTTSNANVDLAVKSGDSKPSVPDPSNQQDSDVLLPPNIDIPSQDSSASNSDKKAVKRKKGLDSKLVEQGRRSERRSSRMKQRSLSRIAETETFQPPELDFRQTLLQLIPRTLQPRQTAAVPLDLDSDTNSQDSSIIFLPPDTESLASSQCSESNAAADSTTLVASADFVVDVFSGEKSPEAMDAGTTNAEKTQNVDGEKVQNQTVEAVVENVNFEDQSQNASELPNSLSLSKSDIEADISSINEKMEVDHTRTDQSKESLDLGKPVVSHDPSLSPSDTSTEAPATQILDLTKTDESTPKQLQPSITDTVMHACPATSPPGAIPGTCPTTSSLSAIPGIFPTSSSQSAIPGFCRTTSSLGATSETCLTTNSESAGSVNLCNATSATPAAKLTSPSLPNLNASTSKEFVRNVNGVDSLLSEELDEEAKEVKSFIEKYNDNNSGITRLLHIYCKHLGRRTHMPWEEGLQDVFLRAFAISQPPIKLEPFPESSLDNKNKITFAFYVLTHLECALDVKYKKHSVDYEYYATDLEYSDMGFIISASCYPEVFEEDSMPEYRFKNFILRFHWVRANYFFLSGDRDSAFRELTVCSKLCIQGTEIKLRHLKHHNSIEQSLIKKRLDSLQRFQILEQVEDLFAGEKYTDIIKLLSPKVDVETSTSKSSIEALDASFEGDDIDARERPKLLKYLIKASVALNEPEVTMKNICFVLQESSRAITHLDQLKQDKNANRKHLSKLFDKWRSLSNFCCDNFTKILDCNIEVLALLEKDLVIRITSSLLWLVNTNMVHLPTKSQFLVKTGLGRNFLQPLVLLFKMSRFEEERLPKMKELDDIPGSIKILLAAHEWLGEKNLCCIDDGSLLLLLLRSLLSYLDDTNAVDKDKDCVAMVTDAEGASDLKLSSGLKKELQAKIEQCIYCLYGYPNKIGKSKALVDHGSQQCTLKWDDAIDLYWYYRPRILPAFDSYKVNTMLSEMAGLLTRITKLITEKISDNLKAAAEVLNDFINAGEADKELNIQPVCCERDMKVIADIFYLLADYHFKHKEMAQAAKYYLNDLCVNPERFDSWAGLALVKSSIVDEKLRLCVTKSSVKEPSVLKLSAVALLCFEKAVTIEQGSTTLWIEFGSLAYWMHSHFSRQARLYTSTTDDKLPSLEKQRSAMLDLAEKCFNSASSCDPDDISHEEWLLQYMLGKVLEKKQKSPQKYLPKYTRSAALLHRRHAKYPKRIQFKSYQSDYAIEALELYFRLHASILKLVQHEINRLDDFDDGEKRSPLSAKDYDLFDDLIEEAEAGNFVRRESLPYSQFYEKPGEGQVKKQSALGKLNVPGSEKQSGLSMGSLVPDSIASALTMELPSEKYPVAKDENSVDEEEASTSVEVEAETVCENVHGESLPVTKDIGDSSSFTPNPSPKLHFESHALSHSPSVQTKPLSDEQRRERARKVMKLCVTALHLCLARLPQHYKSLYRLADLYWRRSSSKRHITWSCDLLLSSDSPWQQLSHMPCQGLLSERNKTNLFNGVWKIPVDEIDRPGSFGCHLYRCILLLLDVLLELKDHNKLLYLHNMLNRNPDQGRKYLQDSDRIRASKLAISYCVKALHKKVITSNPSKPVASSATAHVHVGYSKEAEEKLIPSSESTLTHLLDAGKIYQLKQRMGSQGDSAANMELHRDLLLAAFQKYISACPGATASFQNIEFLSPPTVQVEKVLKFCQQQSMATKAATGPNTPGAASKSDSKLVLGTKKSPFEADRKQDKPSNSFTEKGLSSVLDNSMKRTGDGTSPDDVTKKRKVEATSNTTVGGMFLEQSPSMSSVQDNPMDLSTSSQLAPNLLSFRIPAPADGFSMPSTSTDLPQFRLPTASDNAAGMDFTGTEVFHASSNNNHPGRENGNLTTTTTIQTISVEKNNQKESEIWDSQNEKWISSMVVEENVKIEQAEPQDFNASGKAEVTTVRKGTSAYTKIVPSKSISKISPSPGSAFTPTMNPILMKRNPVLEKLKIQGKAPLLRSASLPESSKPPGHRTLQRTSSISDYTKQKLKSSILMRTSASLVRKPSITEQEIRQVLGDPESSQSEEEEEIEVTFKPLVSAKRDTVSACGSLSRSIDIPIAVTPVSTPSVIEAEPDSTTSEVT